MSDTYIIETEAQAKALLAIIPDDRLIALDCETVGINPKTESPVGRGRIVCFSIAWEDDANLIWKAYIHVRNLPTFAPFLKTVALVGHNIFGFDRHMFANHGVILENIVADTMLMSRLGRNIEFARHGLKKLSEELLGQPMDGFSSLFERPVLKPVQTRDKIRVSKRKGIPTLLGLSWQDIPTQTELIPLNEIADDVNHPAYSTLVEYAALDAEITLRLYPKLAKILRDLPGNSKYETLLDVYNAVWHKQMYPIWEAERNGLYLDPELCAQAVAEYQSEIKPKRIELRRWFGRDINIRSPKQLQEFLYNEQRFEIPPIHGSPKAIKRTKPGERPTSEVAIDWITQNYDVGPLQYLPSIKRAARDIKRLRDFPRHRDSAGRIHYQLSPKTATGRLSASNIPIQQIPKFGALRHAFRAEPGYKLIVADYSQLEMRILAHYLIRLFNDYELANDLSTGDLYQQFADKAGLTRDFAKAVILSINYGKSKFGLAAQLGITVEHAADLLRSIHVTYPGIKRFHTFCESFALRTGYVQTLLGRVRFIPELKATDNKALYGIGFRKSINTPVQGGAADVVAMAMIACHENTYISQNANFCGQIHDELIFRARTECAEQVAIEVKNTMQNAYPLLVELPVNCNVANDWAGGK